MRYEAIYKPRKEMEIALQYGTDKTALVLIRSPKGDFMRYYVKLHSSKAFVPGERLTEAHQKLSGLVRG